LFSLKLVERLKATVHAPLAMKGLGSPAGGAASGLKAISRRTSSDRLVDTRAHATERATAEAWRLNLGVIRIERSPPTSGAMSASGGGSTTAAASSRR
jgi:hypothetical protein